MASTYWEARGIAELSLGRFQEARLHGDAQAERRAFYVLASYYGRTLRIVQSALDRQRPALAVAALRNLVVLSQPLAQMHRAAPSAVPMAVAVDRRARDELSRDLVMRVLGETPEALSEATIIERTNDLHVLGNVAPGTVRRHLKDLQASGHVDRVERGFVRTRRTYTEVDFDNLSLRALVGATVEQRLARAGLRGLHDVTARPDTFRETLISDGQDESVAAALLEAAASVLDARPPLPGAWRHADLLGSPYPRPYQYEAFAVFRGSGYQGRLVESPTGSGKTMIGMLCIQDWLQTLRPGQSILVLVPTANYQQQWIGELCFKAIGLHLPPEAVFAGTPGQLERFQRQTGSHPAVILMTYAALAQTGSGVGKGGFDVDSIELFLQSANVRYVALDEVHKVVEDMRSVSAEVTRQLAEWMRDGSIRGLIGFSGTAEAYRPRFAELGLTLAHAIPLDTLIGYGFVAPFTEMGIGFANSARERQIRDLLDQYKERLLAWRDLLGSDRLRQVFADIPLDERVAIGRQYLGMYRGRADGDAATARRFEEWQQQSGPIGLSETALITVVQIARGWSDRDLADHLELDPEAFAGLQQEVNGLREQLAELIYLPSTIARLRAAGFTTTFDSERLSGLQASVRSAAARAEQMADVLATTIVGLYHSLTDWYLRAGEGRVETIKALIEAERSTRHVSGVIVFDTGRRIRWRSGLTAPGYEGVAGLFAQLLGDRRFVAFAALSSEMYLTYDEADPLPPRIADFIHRQLMQVEVAQAILGMTTQGLDIDPPALASMEQEFRMLVEAYVASLTGVRARRLGEFRRRVLGPWRRSSVKKCRPAVAERLVARLAPGNVHLDGLITTFYDYAELAESFRHARVAEIEQVSGARQRFYVVPMPGGRRKQLMYDLTARIVDAESLPVNLVIVSTWARTGWNVIRPNVLIDATATRDVTAWQQLRGRAMRALGTWTNACYRASVVLRTGESVDGELPVEIADAATHVNPEVRERVQTAGIERLSEAEREALRVGLMLSRNKVTHIYELVKAFGGSRQVEYDRATRMWRRRESIERKHAYESAVDPLSGELARGVAHAPLVYHADPRADLPDQLRDRVSDVIRDRDAAIVQGWLRAADRAL